MSENTPYGYKFQQYEVIGVDECECCGAETQICVDKRGRAYTVCQNHVDMPLQELSPAQRRMRHVGKVKCNRKTWFSFTETVALKMAFVRSIGK